MATPRVFISSTYYDLKYIRERLKSFIKEIGYEPVLSEANDIFYNPKHNTQSSCLYEIPTCHILVLIIGGRYGSEVEREKKSITNTEYDTAINNKIPVFALVESSVLSEYRVYRKNNKNKGISYPSVDNIKIFDFIEEVQDMAVNNAIVPFDDFSNIVEYLKKQWAGMMYNFLNIEKQQREVADTLEEISKVNQKLEVLTTQILKSVGKVIPRATSKLYDAMTASQAYKVLTIFRDENHNKVKVTPVEFIEADSFEMLAKNCGVNLQINDDINYNTHPNGEIDVDFYKKANKSFISLKRTFNGILLEYGINIGDYISEIKNKM